jgi:hypothetical protein
VYTQINAHIARSLDDGKHWSQASLPPTLTVAAIDPRDPSHLLAVEHVLTGSNNNRPQDLIFQSRDGGLSWKFAFARAFGDTISWLAFQRVPPYTIYSSWFTDGWFWTVADEYGSRWSRSSVPVFPHSLRPSQIFADSRTGDLYGLYDTRQPSGMCSTTAYALYHAAQPRQILRNDLGVHSCETIQSVFILNSGAYVITSWNSRDGYMIRIVP